MTTQTPHRITADPIGDAFPQTIGALVLDAARRRPGIALEYRRGSIPTRVSYAELGRRATAIARGLIALGVQAGDRVAIFAATAPEWTLADYGCSCAGAIVAPVYHTNSAPECGYVLAHSGARVAFCGDAVQAAKVAEVRPGCPGLEHVVMLAGTVPGTLTLDELIELGRAVPESEVTDRVAGTDPADVATLVYTSGTTGPPKGCMLTHSNLVTTADMYVERLALGEDHVLYQFLPLAHVLARVAQATVIRAGARISFWSGDPTQIIDELAERRPTHFPAVPRIYEKIHGAVIGSVQDGPLAKRVLFHWAIAQGARAREQARRGAAQSPWERAAHGLADRLVLSRVRRLFGANLEVALVGAAAIAPELLRFFDACGVLVLEGYGLSESCSVATINTPGELRFGTVGRPLPETEVSVAPDGELLLRGPHVFKGYFHDPEATEQALTPDGWLRTGDLGAISPDGFVTITGRKKDLIITSSGKNITPVNIESALRDGRYVNEAVVFGDGRPYLVAMLTLDADERRRLADRLGIAADPATIAADPRVHAEIALEVDAVNARLARIEQIKRFAILDRDLTQADGELTPTMKVRRAAVYEKYADLFASLYDTGSSS